MGELINIYNLLYLSCKQYLQYYADIQIIFSGDKRVKH